MIKKYHFTRYIRIWIKPPLCMHLFVIFFFGHLKLLYEFYLDFRFHFHIHFFFVFVFGICYTAVYTGPVWFNLLRIKCWHAMLSMKHRWLGKLKFVICLSFEQYFKSVYSPFWPSHRLEFCTWFSVVPQKRLKRKERADEKEETKILKLCVLVIVIRLLVSPCDVVIWVWNGNRNADFVLFYLSLSSFLSFGGFSGLSPTFYVSFRIHKTELDFNFIGLFRLWSISIIWIYFEAKLMSTCSLDVVDSTKFQPHQKTCTHDTHTHTQKHSIDFVFIRLLSRWLHPFQSTYSNTLTGIACHFH